jgi:hypothetical protein
MPLSEDSTMRTQAEDAHGGVIHLDGRSEAGTLFKITIPFVIPEGAIK